MDSDTISLLERAPIGLIQFEIGLQSFNEKTLKAINRKANLPLLCDKVKKLISMENIHVHLDLIVGLPYEDLTGFSKSFNSAYAQRPHMLQIGFLKILYGAQMREQVSEHKCKFTDTPPYEILSNSWLNAREIEELHCFEDVFERMYNSRRFGLTCEYIDSVMKDSYEMYRLFSTYVQKNGPFNTLDEFTKAIYDHFSCMNGVDKAILRDKLAIDRLATNKMGSLPEFLKVHSSKIKQKLNELEKNEDTKRPKNVKRAATVMLSENKLIYVDYDECNYVTNRFLVKFTEI